MISNDQKPGFLQALTCGVAATAALSGLVKTATAEPINSPPPAKTCTPYASVNSFTLGDNAAVRSSVSFANAREGVRGRFDASCPLPPLYDPKTRATTTNATRLAAAKAAIPGARACAEAKVQRALNKAADACGVGCEAGYVDTYDSGNGPNQSGKVQAQIYRGYRIGNRPEAAHVSEDVEAFVEQKHLNSSTAGCLLNMDKALVAKAAARTVERQEAAGDAARDAALAATQSGPSSRQVIGYTLGLAVGLGTFAAVTL